MAAISPGVCQPRRPRGILARLYPDLTPGPANALAINEPDLDGEYFLVTGSGQFFRHALDHPNQVFGIVQIVENGTAWRQVWGFSSGARPTSEFPTHLVAHAVRKRVSNGRERMILHAHPPEFIALSFLEPLDSKVLTRALWEKMPECIVIFPDRCARRAAADAGRRRDCRGIAGRTRKEPGDLLDPSRHLASEENPNKVFALVETVEKAAKIHRFVLSAGGPKQVIPADMLRKLSNDFAAIMVAKPDLLD